MQTPWSATCGTLLPAPNGPEIKKMATIKVTHNGLHFVFPCRRYRITNDIDIAKNSDCITNIFRRAVIPAEIT